MLFVAAILLAGVASLSAQFTCYNNNTNPYLFFSSKTAYEFIHEDSTVQDHPGCEPKQFWLLSRHGTRYPSWKDIKKINADAPKLHEKVASHDDIEMCDADIANIRAWKTTILSEDDDEMLTLQGFLDLFMIAQRFRKRFPTLLDIPYDQSKFQFRYTDSPRTTESARAFAEGLFGSSTPVSMPSPLSPDPLIETYEVCPTWLENVDGSVESRKEMKAFIAGPYVTDVVARVSERLGFDSSPINFDEVDLLYDLCRYEKAWVPESLSTWCAAFTEDELKVMEYKEDLKYYYDETYGTDLNTKVGCPPVKDFVERFSELQGGGTSQPNGVFYFTHSTMINMVLSSLGVFKDSQPLTSRNYLTMQDRQWRSSKLGSFASNIAAVFYQCSEGERDRFQLFVEERPVQLDGCPEGELCSWEHVKQVLATTVQQCDLSFCNLRSPNPTQQ